MRDRQVTLHWPLSLAINPVDNTLHILDNNVVIKITADNKVVVVAGRLLHCPPRNPDAGLLNSDSDASGDMETNAAASAADTVLESPQHIAFAADGLLYVVESNGRNVNRVRVVGADGLIRSYAGSRRTTCDCRSNAESTPPAATSGGGCQCFDAGEQLATRMLLDNPTAVTVTPDGAVHVADMGNLRVHSVVPPTPSADRAGGFEVLYPQTNELYTFNRFGHHISTKDIVTGRAKYNFTYSVNSYYGRLLKVGFALCSFCVSKLFNLSYQINSLWQIRLKLKCER
jgi:teneurin